MGKVREKFITLHHHSITHKNTFIYIQIHTHLQTIIDIYKTRTNTNRGNILKKSFPKKTSENCAKFLENPINFPHNLLKFSNFMLKALKISFENTLITNCNLILYFVQIWCILLNFDNY